MIRCRWLSPAVALALVATPAAARRGTQTAFAEPADIIAAEGYFMHLSAAKGAKAAIRATAAADAQIFAPQLQRVAEYANSVGPALGVAWHTRQLWMSCDGGIAVTHGQWQRSPASGWYVVIWQRQKGGGYKWVLVEDGALRTPLPQSDMIGASVADCPARRARQPAGPDKTDAAHGKAAPNDYLSGHSDDNTLEWHTGPAPDGAQAFVLRLKRDGLMPEVLRAIAMPGG